MKKMLILCFLVLGLFLLGDDVKALDVSNEEELRSAIASGGDITLTQNIEVTSSITITKDVTIDGDFYYIYTTSDIDLITVESGNVWLRWIYLESPGTALVINGGTVYAYKSEVYAGNIGTEINGGTFNGEYFDIYGGTYTSSYTYSGGKAIVVNGGTVSFENYDYSYIYSGGDAITVNGGDVFVSSCAIVSYEGNSIYLDGGTIDLNSYIGLSATKYGIYINKGVNTNTGGDVLIFGSDFVFGYGDYGNPNFSIYVNSEVEELRITDEKEFLELSNNKLNLGFCSDSYFIPMSNTAKERRQTCLALNSNYDGTIESNEIGSCTLVYINGVLQNEIDSSCNASNEEEETPTLVVNVPDTFVGSLLFVTSGLIIIIIALLIIYLVIKGKKNV